MKQLVPLLSLTTRRVFCLSAIAVFGILAIRSTPTTQANTNQSGGEMLARLDSPATPLAALTLTVNTLGDQADASVGNGICDVDSGTAGDQCTLRAAIQEANATFAADTIDFSVTGTINLTGALPDIVSDVTITGPGSSQLTVRRDTGGDYRILLLNNRTVRISGLSIANGKAPDGTGNTGQSGGNGGGIAQSGGSLTLTDVAVSGNATGNGAPNTVSGSSSGGWGGFGGGIFSSGSLTMTNCVVSGNTTGNGANGGSGGSGGRGAGIWFGAGIITLTNVVVNNNHTGTTGGPTGGNSGYGGGIWIEGSTSSSVNALTNVTITNNTTGNTVNGETGGGAGLYILGGQATLTNSNVSSNHCGNSTNFGAGSGGGIFNNGNLIIRNSLISGNDTGNQTIHGSNTAGGGIANNFLLTIINSTISGNSTGSGFSTGGGVYNGGTLNMYNCTVTRNSSASSNSCCAGHGVVTGNSSAFIGNSIIAQNGPGGNGPDLSGYFSNSPFNSRGHNLIGNADNSLGFTNGSNGDQTGTTAAPINAQLEPLANNGGPTLTHALLTNSPALDAGDSCVTQPTHCGDANLPQMLRDQRGFNRIVDGPDANTTATVDIGAYEKQAVFPDLPDASTNEDTQAIVAFDLNDVASVTSITATAGNSLVPNNPSVVLVNSTAVLTITPASNLSGTTDITVTVNRTGGSANDTFVLTVVAVNDAPSFTKGSDQSVNENDPAQTVNNWASAISAGPADESGQTVTFQIVTNSNASLFSVAPAISSNGTLTYTPATGMSGTALITIRLSDSGDTLNGGSNTSVTQTFNINILEGGVLAFNSTGGFFSENQASALFTVTRTGGSAGEARIDYETSDGTATAGQDYSSVSGTLIFPHGVTTQSFQIPLINDSFDEPSGETVNLTLKNPKGSGSLGFLSAIQLTIGDDDPTPTLSINDVQLVEGNSGTADAVFTVTLTGQTALQATVGFATSNNTATLSDYQPTSGQLTFNPGETTKTIAVSVMGDTMGETNETFFVNLSSSTNANIVRFRGTGTIINDDTSVQFSSPTYSANESFVSVSFQVNRTGNTSGSSTVNYSTSDSAGSAACSTATGNASSQCDYASRSGTLSFASGETSKTFNVPFVDDGWLEGNESFVLTLSSPGGATLGSPASATVFIVDNDSAGALPSVFMETGASRAIALNSVTFVRGPFSVMDPSNFSADHQTRLIIYTSNLRLTQADPAYLSVQASGVDLPIEKVGTVSGVAGLDASYIVVKLPLGLPTGDLQLIVTLRGTPSAAAVLQIAP
jgi:CSLREA domain-containing protein